MINFKEKIEINYDPSKLVEIQGGSLYGLSSIH